jgi:hypothetical protein
MASKESPADSVWLVIAEDKADSEESTDAVGVEEANGVVVDTDEELLVIDFKGVQPDTHERQADATNRTTTAALLIRSPSSHVAVSVRRSIRRVV